jgi:glycine/D-amino acid oxidase-like deaminating enzyme
MPVTAPDVAIVGGGIVGTSLPVELATRGRRVVLYARAEAASGASGRNSGAIWAATRADRLGTPPG